jgi:rod shape-determining protein MreC
MYCEVTTILSPDTNISATDKVNRESGTISSNAQLSDRGLIKLGLLEAGTTVQAGDMIVTSGIGGKFPKDLLIGKAVEVKPEENDVSLYATVEPFVDIKTVRDVIIITSFNGQGEVVDNTDTNNASSNGG